MIDQDEDIPTQSYWPSVTDLFLTLFIIAIAIVAVVFYALLPTNNVGKDRALVHAVGSDLQNVLKPANRLRKTLNLEPIPIGTKPDQVIVALSETCDSAAARIVDLEKMVGKSGPEIIADLLDQIRDLKRDLAEARAQRDLLQAKLDALIGDSGLTLEQIIALAEEVEDLRKQLHDKPPNIQISEQKKAYRFKSGSSAMGTKFIEGLMENEFKRLAEEIVAREEQGRVKVDTLEIIGHTDGVAVTSEGNLDQKLPDVLADPNAPIAPLRPGSNNDLGLLRALAVREQWELYIAGHGNSGILKKIDVRCYSAGQTILPQPKEKLEANDFQQPDPRARRIEMRLTRLKTADAGADMEMFLEEEEEE